MEGEKKNIFNRVVENRGKITKIAIVIGGVALAWFIFKQKPEASFAIGDTECNIGFGTDNNWTLNNDGDKVKAYYLGTGCHKRN